MTYETITLETDARGVATLSLARADKHNAMSEQMIRELHHATEALVTDDRVRVVVLTADGPTFCAGGDLAWMQKQMSVPPEERGAQAGILAHMLRVLNRLPKPLIGRIQGNTFGGGVGLVSVCDIAIASDNVLMGLTETRLGLIPATIGPYVVARMGAARARQVFMSGRRFDAAEAVRLGLVARAVAPEALDDAVEAEVAPYLACAPGAVAEAKALIERISPSADDALLDDTVAALTRCWIGDEAPEGIAAFFEKRKPRWVV